MAWSASKVFAATVANLFNKDAVAIDCDADTFKAALFDTSITPDNTVTAANSAYGAGVWAGGHLTDTGTSAPAGWPTVGRNLTVTSSFASATYSFASTNTTSANAVTTITAAFGCLVYDDTATSPADQGISFNYFGGTQTVTLGTLTLAWSSGNVFTVAC